MAIEQKHWFREALDWARRAHWIWTVFPASWKAAIWAVAVGLVASVLARINKVTAVHWWLFFLIAVGIYVIVWIVVQKLAQRPEANPPSDHKETKLPAFPPHIVPVGYGKLTPDRIEGVIIENDGAPAYNLIAPEPVSLGATKVVFDDPIITRLTKEDGKRCFEVAIERSPNDHVQGGLRDEMIKRNIDHVIVKIKYADAEKPSNRRYTTPIRLEPTIYGISATLAEPEG